MAKYVIHKKGFYYTDDSYDFPKGCIGNIVDTFDNLEDAKQEKAIQDIYSMQRLKGYVVGDFYKCGSYAHIIHPKLENYFKSEFGITISTEHYFVFPEMTTEQAKSFLDILNLSFHDIVEYPDDKILNPEDFDFEEEDDDTSSVTFI